MLHKPLRHLVIAEQKIRRWVRDNDRYLAWEKRGKPPSPLIIPKMKPRVIAPKQKKHNQLIDLMVTTQLGKCILCDTPLIIDHSLPSDHPFRPSYDHVIPRSKQGKDKGNRLAVHRQCNSKKSNRDPSGCELIWLGIVNQAISDTERKMRKRLDDRL